MFDVFCTFFGISLRCCSNVFTANLSSSNDLEKIKKISQRSEELKSVQSQCVLTKKRMLVIVGERFREEYVSPSWTKLSNPNLWITLIIFDDSHLSILHLYKWLTLHKKWSFPLRIPSVNVTKFAGNCRFGHIYCRNP